MPNPNGTIATSGDVKAGDWVECVSEGELIKCAPQVYRVVGLHTMPMPGGLGLSLEGITTGIARHIENSRYWHKCGDHFLLLADRFKRINTDGN